MKRRDLALYTAASLATSHAARAETAPDPRLLSSSLTPLGAERAGNADGSIPAWTGGLTAPPLPAAHPVDVPLFTGEQPLLSIDATSMAGHQPFLTPGTQALMQTGLRLNIYPTHRTAAAPQYVYDNTAQNTGLARLDPRGGHLGFNGAYGGVPFPIIDTSNPLNGGAQLIWNHLTAWNGYLRFSKFTPSFIVSNAGLTLAASASAHALHPYYDPNGSLNTYAGWYSKSRSYYGSATEMPANGLAQTLVWHSGNVYIWPDIVWTELPGEGRRVRKAPNLAYGAPNPDTNGRTNLDETSCFSGNPSQYDWHYIGKQEMYVPYNCNAMHFSTAQDLLLPQSPNPDIVRWEKHRVWIVEATLRPGNTNPLARRRLYLDEDTWQALLGESYDASGAMVKHHTLYNRCIPSMPGTVTQGWAAHDLRSGEYVYSGSINYASFTAAEYIMTKMPPGKFVFVPQEMAAKACF